MIFEKHRARIDAKGYLQKNIDYFESCAPTVSHITIRLVLVITDVPDFFSYDYDAVCAYISAPLPASERVYIKAYTEIGLTQLKTDECCFMLVKNNVKKGHRVPENFDLNELNEHLIVEIPLRFVFIPRVGMRYQFLLLSCTLTITVQGPMLKNLSKGLMNL
jgi:hypothetical protein